MEEIAQAYFSGGGGALSSEKTFRRAHPEFDKGLVKRFFRDQDVVRQFYGRTNPNKTYASGMVAYYPFERVHVDLADFRKRKKPFKYSFTAACCFTRFVIAIAIRNKNAQTVMDAFQVLYDRIKELRPLNSLHTTFITDAGKEFTNRHLKNKFRRHSDVSFHIARSSLSKAFLAERTNRTLRRKIALLSLQQPRVAWFNHLSTALYSYNETKRRELGDCSPIQAVHLDPQFVDYVREKRTKLALGQTFKLALEAAKKAGLVKGDYVRKKSVIKWTEKGSELPKIQTQVFRIGAVKLPNLNKPRAYPYYRLVTLSGHKVRRLYQRHELVLVDRQSIHHPDV